MKDDAMPGATFRFGEGPPFSEEFLFEAAMAFGYEARQDLLLETHASHAVLPGLERLEREPHFLRVGVQDGSFIGPFVLSAA